MNHMLVKGHSRVFILVIAFAMILSACNMPRNTTPTQSGIDLISTYAAQTVQVQLTQANQPQVTSPVLTPFPTSVPPGQVTPGPGTSTPSTAGCNLATFVQDVSVQDNSAFMPGTPFTKTWRIKNSGSCTWTENYVLFFFKGDQMGAADSVPLGKRVSPGETVDISVNMQAPNESGSYKGEWKLRSEANEVFGTGSNANPIWVQILVATTSSIDFVTQASAATWRSGADNQPAVPLGFGGDINDPNGVAKVVDNLKLENGRMSGKVLLTYPRHDPTGYTSGFYAPYLIQNGNHFEARLGFLANQDGTCGVGKVVFLLRYKEGDQVTELGRWSKSCDGSLLPVDVDLSRIAGKNVQFILTVIADGSFQDDWAVWNSPQITK